MYVILEKSQIMLRYKIKTESKWIEAKNNLIALIYFATGAHITFCDYFSFRLLLDVNKLRRKMNQEIFNFFTETANAFKLGSRPTAFWLYNLMFRNFISNKKGVSDPSITL